MTTKGKLIVVGVAVVALGAVFMSSGLGGDLASSVIRMRIIPPTTTGVITTVGETTTINCQDKPITREEIVEQSKLHMSYYGGKLNPPLHPNDLLTPELVELLKKEILGKRARENCDNQSTTEEPTTSVPPTSENIAATSPVQQPCDEADLARITQEVNALVGQEYLNAVLSEIVPYDAKLKKIGSAVLRDYVIKNVGYFKARLIQVRLSKICPPPHDNSETIDNTQSIQECVNSCF